MPSTLLAGPPADSPMKQPQRIAAVNTVYRPMSHAHHICRRFLVGFEHNGFHYQPAFRVVRMYNDQYPVNDIGRRDAKRYDVELADTVAAALAPAGELDVDAVLLIGEHGQYPENEFGQTLYPRFELFEQIVDVFKKSGRAVPVFNDKHLSYDHRQAAQMVETARAMNFGLMAGSSLPVTWRRPELELPLESPITEALVCHGGQVERYGFHGLETLQCMMERRRGGETGVQSVTCLAGDAVWKAGEAGLWSWRLLREALSRSPSKNIGPIQHNAEQPAGILVEYKDGTRGAALNLHGHVHDFTFAAELKNKPGPVSCSFYLPSPPGAKYFDALSLNIEKHFQAGASPYPIERTLLTTTVLDWAMHSLHEQGAKQEDKSLSIAYQPPADSGFARGHYTAAGR